MHKECGCEPIVVDKQSYFHGEIDSCYTLICAETGHEISRGEVEMTVYEVGELEELPF